MEKSKKILLGGIIVSIIVGAVLFYFLDENQPLSVVALLGPKIVEPLSNGSIPPPSSTIQAPDISLEGITDWDTCRNEKYGYEFRYPRGWNIGGTPKEDVPQVRGVALCERGTYIIISAHLPPIYFSFGALNKDDRARAGYPEVKSVDDWYQDPSIVSNRSFVQKETTIDGERALWYGEGEKGVIGNGVMFFHKEIVFEIYFSGLDPEFREAIVSTFKFID